MMVGKKNLTAEERRILEASKIASQEANTLALMVEVIKLRNVLEEIDIKEEQVYQDAIRSLETAQNIVKNLKTKK